MTPPSVLPRRDLLLVLASAAISACARETSAPTTTSPSVTSDPTPDRDLADLETYVGGRLGVFALDTASGRTLAHRADERFAMCSTFKWVLAAAVLARVDRGELAIDQRIPYGKADLLDHCPVTGEHVAEGALALERMARAAVTVSDNGAANLLLAQVGGPAGLTAFVRQAGDSVTRLDRNEGALNSNVPGDPRDTTSPRAMVGLQKAILCGDVLAPASRERLLAWMKACETGKDRLRAGFPADWTVGDKTGTGENMAVNDLAIAIPPGRAPVLVAVYTSEGIHEDDGARHLATHQRVAKLVTAKLV
jgi:beta-lactamase class A